MRRRPLLSTLALGATAGCLGGVFETTNSRSPPVLDGRPDAVYVPSHQEGMEPVGQGTAGDLTVAVTYSYPHRFWTVEREDGAWTTARTEVDRDDAVHLMVVAFHEPTGTVVPNAGVSVEVAEDGSLVSQETIYTMLSQRMGAHYGANFSLPGDGDYEVTVSVGGSAAERYGAFEGLFDDPATTTVPFPYREAERNDIDFERFRARAGTRGAIDPMSMGMFPDGRVPDPLPGDRIGTATVGDARFVGVDLDADRFGGPYLAVSAQTPYNHLPIPGVGLSATVGGDEVRLRPSLDPALGFHYGAPVDVDAPVTLAVEVPAQVARHEGYETAFLATGTATLSE